MFKFGVEIEFNTRVSDSDVVDAMQRENIDAVSASRLGNGGDRWAVKYDGSIGAGWELVSPILYGADGLDQIRRVTRSLRHLDDARVSPACGLHVHLSGIDRFDLPMIKNIVRRYVNFEDTFDMMQPLSRRGNANRYCRSNLLGFSENPGEATALLWEKVQETRNVDNLVSLISPSRYVKVNLQSMPRHGTVEFRHHAGTVSGEKIVQWVKLLQGFGAVAANQKRLWHRPAETVEAPEQRVRKMLRGLPSDVASYVKQRIAALNR
jgi:hypothetical protein